MPIDELAVQAYTWDQFARWFKKQWEPGQHVALIGPTGVGKTTFALGILPMRKYSMAYDPKGGDTNLGKIGFQRITAHPLPRKIRTDIDEGRPARLIIGPVVRNREDRPKQISLFRQYLRDAFTEGGWTVYIDELQVMADRMKLTDDVVELLIAARDRGVSVVSSFQRPANVPRAASDQTHWLMVWATRDVDVVNRLAEMAGRPKAEIRGAIRGLDKHDVMIFSRNPRDPLIVTRAPRV